MQIRYFDMDSPDYCYCLEEGNVHERNCGRVVINNMESVDAALIKVQIFLGFMFTFSEFTWKT